MQYSLKSSISVRLNTSKFTIFTITPSHHLSVHSCTGILPIFVTGYVNISVLGSYPCMAKNWDN